MSYSVDCKLCRDAAQAGDRNGCIECFNESKIKDIESKKWLKTKAGKKHLKRTNVNSSGWY